MKSYRITIKDRAYDVQIEDIHASPVRVTVNGESLEVSLEEPAVAAPAARITNIERRNPPTPPAPKVPRPATPAAGERTVIAPMPGTIMDIQIAAGQSMERGQVLCNLEAMKMKNAIRSPMAGVIAQVVVNEGQSVAYGETLFIFE